MRKKEPTGSVPTHATKRRLSRVAKAGLTVVMSVCVVYVTAQAGSLTPPVGAPSATFYTLTDIYQLINSNTTTTEGDHDFTFTDALAGSGYTLTQIYDALTGLINPARVLTGTTYLGVPGTYNATNLSATSVRSGIAFGVGLTGAFPSASSTLDGADATTDLAASSSTISSSNGSVEWWSSSGTRYTATLDFPTLSNLCNTDTSNSATGTLAVTSTALGVGNTVCGTAGTLLANLFNGTHSSFTGGSQANGGGDDYNGGAAPAGNRYASSWTVCNSGNNYCGTGDSGADAKDDAAGLIWSLPCNGSGCATFSDSSPIQYSWDNSHANNNGRTASQLCSDHSGWSLPHQKQLMQAYINGAYGNVEASGTTRYYWMSTTASGVPTDAWMGYLSTGYMFYYLKDGTTHVRCVRPAP